MGHIAALVTAVVLAALTGSVSAADAAAGTKHSDKGKLAAPPLIYRDVPGYLRSVGYVVFFHTKGSFFGVDPTGDRSAGDLLADGWIGDFGGTIGPGISGGRCYDWTILPNGAKLNKVKVGQKVSLTFKLRHTSTQRRTVRLRALPKVGDPTRWIYAPRLKQDLRQIGCRPKGGLAN